mmetsp:Transcript_182/g.295  ORF Transcript_182/g.295 Transcript_182/m.295 type:complete len:220 (+) Transcript_182:1906-2565(+)
MQHTSLGSSAMSMKATSRSLNSYGSSAGCGGGGGLALGSAPSSSSPSSSASASASSSGSASGSASSSSGSGRPTVTPVASRSLVPALCTSSPWALKNLTTNSTAAPSISSSGPLFQNFQPTSSRILLTVALSGNLNEAASFKSWSSNWRLNGRIAVSLGGAACRADAASRDTPPSVFTRTTAACNSGSIRDQDGWAEPIPSWRTVQPGWSRYTTARMRD